MKNDKLSAQPSPMSADSQKRLLAYSTAASLGAFFAGQSTEAEVVQAAGLAPYPHVFLPPALGVTGQNNFYLSIEGGTITNFHLYITQDITTSLFTNKYPAQLIRMPGFVPDTNNPAVVNGQVLSTLRGTSGSHGYTNSYCVAFLGGAIIGNNTNSPAPWYQPQLGISYNFGSAFPWKNYVNSSFKAGFPNNILGFRFTSSADGQEHFGYMDVKTTFVPMTFEHLDPDGNPTTSTKQILQSVVVNDCVYETTPGADITVPKLVKATSIINNMDLDGSIEIRFGPNSTENDPAEAFVLETSPTLGPSASWVSDNSGYIEQLTQATFGNPIKPATYHAVTYPTPGATSQYWRIKKL